MWVYPSKTCNKCRKIWERCSAEVVQKNEVMLPEGNANVRLPCCLRSQPFPFFSPFTSLRALFPALSLEKNPPKHFNPFNQTCIWILKTLLLVWKKYYCFIDVSGLMQWQFGTSVVSEVSEATTAVECEVGKKLVLFCIFPIVPWDNTIKYELVLFSVLFWLPYMVWCSQPEVGSHRRQGSFQTAQKIVNGLYLHSTFSSLSNCS